MNKTVTTLGGFLIVALILGGLIYGGVKLVGANNDWNASRGRGDAEVGKVDSKARTVYQMPDRFKNIAETCDEFGNAIVSTTSDGGGAQMYAIKDGCQ